MKADNERQQRQPPIKASGPAEPQGQAKEAGSIAGAADADAAEAGSETSDAAAKATEAFLVDPDDKKAVRQSILRLAGPSLVEMMLANFTQMLSMIMVGRLSPEAVATVGLTNQPFFLFLAIFSTLNVGTTVIVARSIGAGRLDEADRAAGQAFLLNIVLSVIMIYAKFVFLSIGFTTISMSFSATLRGAGDTRTPMKINVVANILVVLIGFPLIYGIGSYSGMGITGAGVATF
ncbi:MAG: efflux family protein, partial [Paenibacillus sp.]|nr:efflux family protein [Paenibacillus sp.]